MKSIKNIKLQAELQLTQEQLKLTQIELASYLQIFEEVMQKNNTKLRLRYPGKFTEDNALNRNLENERKVFGHKKLVKTSKNFQICR